MVSDRILGLIFVALVTLLLFLSALSARADDRRIWQNRSGMVSVIILQPTDAPGAVAEVFFDNRPIHARDEDVTFDLDAGGLIVTVTAYVGRGITPDRIEVITPPGFYAMPASIDVAENDVGRVLIYVGDGVGM